MLLINAMVYPELQKTLDALDWEQPRRGARAEALNKLIGVVKDAAHRGSTLNLNFICTHNSRRSHFSQIWARVAAVYFGFDKVQCYSGGTAETQVYPKVLDTLVQQGMQIKALSHSSNPVYAVKYEGDAMPLLSFSKLYDHPFNPEHNFSAIMVCADADEACPIIAGANAKIQLPYTDPKISDGTPAQSDVYAACSLTIAQEMFYVFSKAKT